MQEKCAGCRYFRQHYTLDQRRLFRVHCGHCVCEKPKSKRPTSKACSNFEQGSTQEFAFASKEYLSKELIRYMMELELLPIIESEEESG